MPTNVRSLGMIRLRAHVGDTTWVEPKFEAEVTYGHITGDGLVRHPSFKRLAVNLT